MITDEVLGSHTASAPQGLKGLKGRKGRKGKVLEVGTWRAPRLLVSNTFLIRWEYMYSVHRWQTYYPYQERSCSRVFVNCKVMRSSVIKDRIMTELFQDLNNTAHAHALKHTFVWEIKTQLANI